jgi:hypothetical protein
LPGQPAFGAGREKPKVPEPLTPREPNEQAPTGVDTHDSGAVTEKKPGIGVWLGPAGLDEELVSFRTTTPVVAKPVAGVSTYVSSRAMGPPAAGLTVMRTVAAEQLVGRATSHS